MAGESNADWYYRKLQTEKEQLEKKIASAKERESLQESTRELSLYDNHPADIASENFEREKDVTLRREDWKRYREINRALEKLKAGSFGFCEACGKKIDPVRLAEIPEAPLCFACQKRKEEEALKRTRPLEEEVLSSPFRATVPGIGDNAAYDREDAWQDVSRYNKRPHVYEEDVATGEAEEGENAGYVEETDRLSNRDNKKQLE